VTAPGLVAALAACAAAALLVPGCSALAPARSARPVPGDSDWLRRWRLWWVLLSGAAVAVLLGGALGLAAAPVAGAVTWTVIERAEPAHVRRDRDRARRDLPHLVGLLSDALRSGQPPQEAMAVVGQALPGPAADRLSAAVARLRLGVDPTAVWAELAADPALGPLGRALARAHRTGASVVPAVDRLAGELARSARAEVEDQARAVGVKAAVPLGLCLLPAFVLIGIVPVVGALLTDLGI
jgi:Flp pilus assembly protein TadB